MQPLSSKLLVLLQFTRAALVFTALADTLCALLLQAHSLHKPLNIPYTLIALTASGCLYAFGMALNDLVDRRRDALLAATRPIPSGRLGVYTAHIIVSALALSSLAFGSLYALLTNSPTSFCLLLLTLLLINFYNFAGKYLVSAGILTLGLVRFTHAITFAPDVPVLWHPLWLFTHIIITSAVAYVWEEKRPRITPVHSATLYLGVAATNILTVAITLSLREDPPLLTAITLSTKILLPITATLLFIYVAHRIAKAVGTMNIEGSPPRDQEPILPTPPQRTPHSAPPQHSAPSTQHSPPPSQLATRNSQLSPPLSPPLSPLRARRRQAGQRLMLAALLWLIVYDAAFALAYVGYRASLVILALLPLAYFSVRCLRAWSRLLSLSRPPKFRTATTL